MSKESERARASWPDRLGQALPNRWHWLALLCGPTSYILIVSALAVVAAKVVVMQRLEGVTTGASIAAGLISPDITLHLFLAALFSVGEAKNPRLLTATLPLALMLSVFAVINALYLSSTGEQLTLEAFTVGLEQSKAVFGILAEEGIMSGTRVLGLLLLLTLPLSAFYIMRGVDRPVQPERGRGRAKAAASIGLAALLLSVTLPSPEAIPLRVLKGNAALKTYWQWAFGEEADEPGKGDPMRWFQGYVPERMASEDAARALGASAPANLLVVILESVRFESTSLAGPDSPSKTPNLLALAERGTLVRNARAVMPHTTKSIFSILCGRLPMMQRQNIEAAANAPVQCLPSFLREAGYDNVFMQTALGAFEDRPRLVERLGFAHFAAWEEIQGEPVGYLASDDESLAPRLESWLDARQTRGSTGPFMATLLTSATHHPYRLSTRNQERAKQGALATEGDQERYERNIEAQDELLGAIVDLLARRSLTESTIVLVVGDHGEGFGAKGVKQHDNNFYDEGLRVPLVIAGKGVPKRLVEHQASLIDIVPSLLEVLGVHRRAPYQDVLPGRSVFASDDPARKKLFACYFDGYCYGYVQDNTKVIIAKEGTLAWYFDLAADPEERVAKELTPELKDSIPGLFEQIDARRTQEPPLRLPLTGPFGAWQCPEGANCSHPNNPPNFFFDQR